MPNRSKWKIWIRYSKALPPRSATWVATTIVSKTFHFQWACERPLEATLSERPGLIEEVSSLSSDADKELKDRQSAERPILVPGITSSHCHPSSPIVKVVWHVTAPIPSHPILRRAKRSTQLSWAFSLGAVPRPIHIAFNMTSQALKTSGLDEVSLEGLGASK